MLRLILPVILLAVGVGSGVGAGLLLGPDTVVSGDATASAETAESAVFGSHPPALDPGESAVALSGRTEFVRLSNQFVVPIVRSGAVRSLVVMSLTLEVATGQTGVVLDREPRLRDAFLQVMFAHANAGGFDGSFTQASAMDPLREALGEAATQALGNILRDVLIIDITRQDA
jgi:hypothetical protein